MGGGSTDKFIHTLETENFHKTLVADLWKAKVARKKVRDLPSSLYAKMVMTKDIVSTPAAAGATLPRRDFAACILDISNIFLSSRFRPVFLLVATVGCFFIVSKLLPRRVEVEGALH